MDFYKIVIFIKHHAILISIWCALLCMIVYTMIVDWIRRAYEISCNDAVLLINRNNATVIDVRTQNEYCSCYIINSINIPFVDFKKNNILLHKKFRDNPLIIVNNGTSSYSIKKYLNKLGYMKVYVLKGGIHSWKNHEFPLLSKK